MTYTLENPTITDTEVAFGSTKYLPKMKDIPEDFFKRSNVYVQLFNAIFFKGLVEFNYEPMEGFSKDTINKVIASHAGSFMPKHEHKEAGVAYMMSLMFKNPTWKTA